MLATAISEIVPCLFVKVRGSLSFTDSEDRAEPTMSGPTLHRRDISRSLHFVHSKSPSSRMTARRLSSFVRRWPCVAFADAGGPL
jgi:hypothetical protein